MTYCVPCDRYFRNLDAYFQHMTKSSLHNYCSDCGEDFESWAGLRQHWIQSSSHSFCRQCDSHFPGDVALLEHCINAHSYCARCDRFFRNDQGLHEHNRQVHHYCVECRRVFESASNLNNVSAFVFHDGFDGQLVSSQHMRSRAHCPTNVPCAFQHRGCTKYFVSNSAMILHLETGTCVSRVDRESVNRFIRQKDRRNAITVPQRLLTDGGETKRYIATERSWNGQAYECVLCHNTFRTLGVLNLHLASPRHQERIYHCPHGTCHATFSALSALCQHVESEKCGVMRFVRDGMDRLLGGMNRLCIEGESEVVSPLMWH